MQKTPYKNPKKILAQIWRTLKRKISVTCCFATRYADFGGERGRRYQVTILRNSLILNSCTSQNFIFFALLWRRTGARQNAPNH